MSCGARTILVAICLFSMTSWAHATEAEEDQPLATGMVETVSTQTFYLCDGYGKHPSAPGELPTGEEEFGTEHFYYCAKRLFREAEGNRPAPIEHLMGRWVCRSAFDGVTDNWEQHIKIARYQRKTKPKNDQPAIDNILIMEVDGELDPGSKQMNEYFEQGYYLTQERGFYGGARLIRVDDIVGQLLWDTDHDGVSDQGEELISTPWAYGMKAMSTDHIFSNLKFHRSKNAIRVYKGNLVLEHVVNEEEKDHLIELNERRARRLAGEKREVHRDEQGRASAGGMFAIFNNVVEDMEIEAGRYQVNPKWEEEYLRPLRPLADYGEDWTFPIIYSECRRQWEQ